MIWIINAGVEPGLGWARDLFREYALEWSTTIADTLSVQGFEGEVAGLPGRYAPPSGSLLVLMDGESPAGCVAVRDLGGGTSEMKRLYVRPTARGRGLGRYLVEAALREADRAGHRRMVLDTLPEMVGAIRLYRSFGFVETDRYWDHPVPDAIFLGRPVGS